MPETMLKILKSIKNSFFISILLVPSFLEKEITNLYWKKAFTLVKKYLTLETQQKNILTN